MTNPAHFELWRDHMLLYNFVNKLLDPECYGFAVTAEVRDAARVALGMEAVETRQPAKTQPESYRHEGYGSVYDEVERISLQRNDK
jgi:hypothetical protein